jgi:RNA polymerase sigma-70 factor (ECF subfamily)
MDPLDQLRLRVLVLKCQIGDRPSWEELYRRYNPPLGYYLRRLIGRDQTAEDVQQEVWLAVIRNIAHLKSPEALTVWLFRIARSKAMKHLSAEHKDVPLDEEMADAPDEGMFSASDAAQVHAALDGLVPEHRDVLLLRFMEGLSYEQIAEVIECNIGTVRSRIHYGKPALRRQLENEHE